MIDKPLIDISHLSIKEPKHNKNILDTFDYTLQKGEIHSIIGESGSGKTTFILSLFSLFHPNLKIQYEKFNLFEKDYFKYSPSDWNQIRGKRIALIPQNPSVAFHPYIKIGNQIEEFLNYKRKEKIEFSKIIHSLEEIGIANAKEKSNKYPLEISGGERQRILIASSVLMNPEILVADEPTSSLDPVGVKNVLQLLTNITRERKIGLVLVSHDMKAVKSISDKITVLKNGKKIETSAVRNGKIIFTDKYSKALFSLSKFYKNTREKNIPD